MRKLLFLAALLMPLHAYAAKRIALNSYIPSFSIGSTQSVAFTNVAGSVGMIIPSDGGSTELVRIVVSQAAFVVVNSSPNASPTDLYLPANTELIVEMLSRDRVSAKQVNGTGGGNLYVTHLPLFPAN